MATPYFQAKRKEQKPIAQLKTETCISKLDRKRLDEEWYSPLTQGSLKPDLGTVYKYASVKNKE